MLPVPFNIFSEKLSAGLLLIATFTALSAGRKATTVGAAVSVELMAVIEKSSMAIPSSEPAALKSVNLIQMVAPLAMLNPLIEPEIVDVC